MPQMRRLIPEQSKTERSEPESPSTDPMLITQPYERASCCASKSSNICGESAWVLRGEGQSTTRSPNFSTNIVGHSPSPHYHDTTSLQEPSRNRDARRLCFGGQVGLQAAKEDVKSMRQVQCLAHAMQWRSPVVRPSLPLTVSINGSHAATSQQRTMSRYSSPSIIANTSLSPILTVLRIRLRLQLSASGQEARPRLAQKQEGAHVIARRQPFSRAQSSFTIRLRPS